MGFAQQSPWLTGGERGHGGTARARAGEKRVDEEDEKKEIRREEGHGESPK